MSSTAIETPLGTIGIEASDVGVRRVRLPGDAVPDAPSRSGARAGSTLVTAAEQLAEYASGEREEFELELDWAGVDATHRRVLETLCQIAPFGTTVTYGELGRHAGVDDARDVGVLMARNPVPLVVPCHRVVAAGGPGSYGSYGVAYKRRLLELEGAVLR
jgi:methylated-DNA-[protein]-cysteine S-methyltransferase